MAHDDLGFVEDNHDDLGFVEDQSARAPAQKAPNAATQLFNKAGSYLEEHLPEGVKSALGAHSAYGHSAIKSASLGYLDPTRREDAKHPIASAVGSLAGGVPVGVAASALMPEIAGGGILARLGRTGANGVAGGVQGLIRKPEGEDSLDARVANAKSGAKIGATLSGGFEGIGALLGVGKTVGDKAMQFAAGMRKNNPGVGTSLADQGVWGTKNMMTNQVAEKLPQAEKELMDTAKSIKGTYPTDRIADEVSEVGNKFKLPSTGEVPGNVQNQADKVNTFSKQIRETGGFHPGEEAIEPSVHTVQSKILDEAGRPITQEVHSPGSPGVEPVPGKLSAEDLVSTKRQGDWLGYTASGNPASSLEAELGQAQGDASRKGISELSGGKMNDILAKERALVLARKSLNKPEVIHQGLGSKAFFGRVPGSSLGASSLAQILNFISKAQPAAESPITAQSLTNALGPKR